MVIIATSREYKNYESDKDVKIKVYNLVNYNGGENVKDHIGDVISVKSWVRFKRENYNGVEQDSIVMVTDEGEIYASISRTFIRSFNDVYSVFGEDDLPPIEITSGISKNGSTFVNCRPA